MSMNKKDGGPTFPLAFRYDDQGQQMTAYQAGMTLRDHFATHASEADIRAAIEENPSAMLTRPQARYVYADAMLRAREA